MPKAPRFSHPNPSGAALPAMTTPGPADYDVREWRREARAHVTKSRTVGGAWPVVCDTFGATPRTIGSPRGSRLGPPRDD
jgi:hypothetical protein